MQKTFAKDIVVYELLFQYLLANNDILSWLLINLGWLEAPELT